MINRIRDIRRERGMTLADVAARCDPPTTAQTIGRLETGTRQLSLGWMNRIAAALEVDPQLLVRGAGAGAPKLVARLGEAGAEPLALPRDAILPSQMIGEAALVALAIEASIGEYRAGDQLWLRQIADPAKWNLHHNRDVLVPRPGGRFAFGRLVNRDERRLGVLPPVQGLRLIVIENPAWLAVAEMLVRRL